MKHSMKTALTAAAFAAALSISSAETAAAAQIAFSPASQRAAAMLYGPPPVDYDMDENWNLDARDMSRMKRILLEQMEESSDARARFYPYFGEDSAGSADVRRLRNLLTGMNAPVEFDIRIRWVPYLSTEVPESAEERQALEAQAKEKQDADCFYYFSATNEKGENVNLRCGSTLGNCVIPKYESSNIIPVSFKETPDADHPERTTLHVRLDLRRMTEYEEGMYLSDSSVLDLIKREPNEGDIQLDLALCSRLVQRDGSVQVYDKCEVEYDILTGKVLVHESLTPEQQFSDFADAE